ncbi:olfactory receptor 10AG1-like [Bufo gargarizans]|uniref:olfactory receptor 10AG1-like n=1 Tax=Bufo gargarizans TaxID=30331 RepID=UPI001CF5F64C|nr:olfactory receptor 10AG1-like [Bufo gargarizans]
MDKWQRESTEPQKCEGRIFTFFLCAYIFTLVSNGLIILTISLESILQKPMYFFLRNLSVHELCFTTVTVPKLLQVFISKDLSISFSACAIQMFIFFTIGVSECVFLGFMAFDRYMAICHPLRYTSVMNTQMCYQLSVGSWVIGSFVSLGQTSFVFSLPYCGSNLIAHYFCDIPPLLKLACTNTFINELSVFIVCMCGAGVPFLLILCSYVNIMISILLIHSSEGRHKALSTCSAHLTSVILFYGTTMLTYLRIDTYGSDKNDRFLSLFYCIIIPAINPLIYSLRNKEMKTALRKVIFKIPNTMNEISY